MPSIFDRLAAGPAQLQPQDFQDWNQMVGSAPPEKFGRAAFDSVRKVDPRDYYEHTQPGVGGTDPFGSLGGGLLGQVAGSLLGNLFNRGLDQQQVMRDAGVQQLDPNRMSPGDLAQLAQWAQRNHPQAFGYTASQYQNQPNVLQALLGNKALMGMLTQLGSAYVANKMSGRRGGSPF
jgi:hypothetical protein